MTPLDLPPTPETLSQTSTFLPSDELLRLRRDFATKRVTPAEVEREARESSPELIAKVQRALRNLRLEPTGVGAPGILGG